MQNQTLVLFSSFIVLEWYNARWPPGTTLKAILKTSCVLLIFIEYVEYIFLCCFFLVSSVSITSVGEERANLSAVVYL